MKTNILFALLILLCLGSNPSQAQKTFDYTLNTDEGNVVVHILGHASLMFEWNNQNIYVDPYSSICDFSSMPKADLILISHENNDHFDQKAINLIKKDSTLMIYTATCKQANAFAGSDTTMANGDSIDIDGLPIKAIAAYNIVNSKHVKGVGNGYVISFANRHVYIAGDTEFIPEMSNLGTIDLAFLGYSSLNMTLDMFVEAVKTIMPTIVVPYHYDNSNISSLVNAIDVIDGVRILTEAIQPSGCIQLCDPNCTLAVTVDHGILSCNQTTKNDQLFIFSILGRKLYSEKITNNTSFDVSQLTPGLYILRVKKEDKILSVKFMVKD